MNQPFVKIEDKYYVRHDAAVVSGVNSNTLYQRSKRSREKWGIIKDPNNGSANLYDWSRLKDEDRDLIKAHYGSEPPEYLAMQPIRDMIVKDTKAEDFFMTYTYMLNSKPTHLKPEWIQEYTRNASLLNMLTEVMKDKRLLKKKFGMKLLPWFDQVSKLIVTDKYNLPTSYANLVSRETSVLKKYQKEGYASLISGKVGAQNAAKVTDLAKDMMLELLSNPNQFDDAYITTAYNKWAAKQGYKTITSATTQNKRIEYGYLITADREGWGEHNKIYSRSVQRMTPSYPGALWEGDDNHIDWWFADDKYAGVTHRLKAYVVVDSYKGIEYPLGWAFSENDITVETVRLAFLMAARHIQELTGGYYLPFEVKTDRWQLSSLQLFYERIGKYYPTPVGSKNRGWIENFFGHADWKRSLKLTPTGMPTNNYTGHNVISKTIGVNMEALTAAKTGKQLPKLSEAGEWISAHFERLRTMPIGWDADEKSRQQLWLEAWAELPEEKKRPISKLQFLDIFGFWHEANGGNAITKDGVQPTIAKQSYSYAVPPAYYLQNVGRKVKTVFDPFDMSQVLITDGEQLRFVANHITPVAGCMADMKKQGGRDFLNVILEEKRNDVDKITEAKKQRRERLIQSGMDVEMTLKIGAAARKELKQAAVEEWDDINYTEQSTKQITYNAQDDDNVEANAVANF